jgi:hypothetical protein
LWIAEKKLSETTKNEFSVSAGNEPPVVQPVMVINVVMKRKFAACVWNPTLVFLSLTNQTSQHFCNVVKYYNTKFRIAYFSKKRKRAGIS